MRLWNDGWARGFADEHIPHWRFRSYPTSYILGYRAGKLEIDELVEEADQDRSNEREG